MNEENDFYPPRNFSEKSPSPDDRPEFSQGSLLGVQHPREKKKPSLLRTILLVLLFFVLGAGGVFYFLKYADRGGDEEKNPFGTVPNKSKSTSTEEKVVLPETGDPFSPDEFRIALLHMKVVFDTLEGYPKDLKGVASVLEDYYEKLPIEEKWIGKIQLDQALQVIENGKIFYSVSPDQKWFHIGMTEEPKSKIFREDIDFDSGEEGWLFGFSGSDTKPCGEMFFEGGCFDFGHTPPQVTGERIEKLGRVGAEILLYFETHEEYPELLDDVTGSSALRKSQIIGMHYTRNASGTAYHLGISVPTAEHPYFAKRDADFNSATAGWENGFNGSDDGPCTGGDDGKACYDLYGEAEGRGDENKNDPVSRL